MTAPTMGYQRPDLPTINQVVDPASLYDRNAAINTYLGQAGEMSGNATNDTMQHYAQVRAAAAAAEQQKQAAAAQKASDAANAANANAYSNVAGATGSGIGSGTGNTAGGNTTIWGDPRSAGWQGKNLTQVAWGHGHHVTVNRAAASAFSGFLKAVGDRGYKLNDVQGYNLRGKRSNPSSLSEHAFGTAIDINPGKNPANFNGKLITNMPTWIGALAAKYGLLWGGYWTRMPDPMHFEYRAPSKGKK